MAAREEAAHDRDRRAAAEAERDEALSMLDEVMAGLNPTEISAMLTTLERLRTERGLTFVIVEHVIGALMTLSDRILVLDHGERIAFGTPEEIGNHDRVAEVYFG